ncbi:succinylglutamate desuccinylase [Marinomonas sp. S3726]|uniref:DUF1826 domain-containing protein n=1 Tax=Marinomonas sp. S3726 TaxID=579484 RepID=UPI00061EE294|nr:DUF1826 domain-containing protein [Marinomonas sp. S3726]KJZ16016.1 succinylglutamate desuccinylase [Marinomonas sp. S3726]
MSALALKSREDEYLEENQIDEQAQEDALEEQVQGKFIVGQAPDILTEVYQQDTNIVVWQRDSDAALQQAIDAFLSEKDGYKRNMAITPELALDTIHKALGNTDDVLPLSQNIAELVEMFCCLFDLERAGLRLTILDSAMCPRFHVDRVPCRLVTTYKGVATQWLPHSLINRSALGVRAVKDTRDQSGLYQSQEDIQQLTEGDVALLKGELWPGNENAGLVHRSPTVEIGEKRLLLTLDFLD